MAVEMIGGPRLCEPLLATGLGRFTGAASRQAFREIHYRLQSEIASTEKENE